MGICRKNWTSRCKDHKTAKKSQQLIISSSACTPGSCPPEIEAYHSQSCQGGKRNIIASWNSKKPRKNLLP
jgi:hypothetical protein